MPTSTTNTYEIHIRLVDNTPFAVPVSPDNRCQVKPPVLMRGVPAILRIKLFRDGAQVTAAELSALYTGFRLVIANDFDDDTAPILVSDDGEASIDQETGELIIPVSSMNTEELATLIGVSERIDLGAELQMFNSSVQDEPIEAYQFPISVQNRRDLTGNATPTPGGMNYYNKEQTDAAIANAIASAQGISSQQVTTLSGASGTVEPGKVYSLAMSEDFELAAASPASGNYGESVLFVDCGEYTFSVASGITLDAEMSSNMRYRLLISWTPFGVMVEATGEWLAE